jgi:hypothetical protein
MVAVPTISGLLALAAPALSQPMADHRACCKLEDPRTTGAFTVTVGNPAVTVTCRGDGDHTARCRNPLQ